MSGPQTLYGLLAEFADAKSLVAAARRVREAGYKKTDAYSPFPVHGLAEALGMKRSAVPFVVLTGAITGALAGYSLQFIIAVIVYPINIGGRPLNSWPSFVPVTFEMTILFGALAGVLGMLALNGLPTPHHPLFAIPQFDHASRDGFFLCIEATDKKYDYDQTKQFLNSLEPREVIDVPR